MNINILQGSCDGLAVTLVVADKKLGAVYARPDADNVPWVGDVFGARVTRYASGQRAFFLDIGAGREAFLPERSPTRYADNARLTVRIERPAAGAKAARVVRVDDDATQLGLITLGPADAALAQRDFPNAVFGDAALFADYQGMLAALDAPFVPVDDGLNLVIEPTAAFVAVDVNNASRLKPPEANRRALGVLAHQMRLRNLRGAIIVDALRLSDRADQVKLLHDFSTLLAADPTPVRISGFTRLGHIEMTRQASGLAWHELRAV